MRQVILAAAGCWLCCAALPALADQSAATDKAPAPFDGAWTTMVTCPAADGALPYSYQFLSHVKANVLHGERGVDGAPGWLELDGRILPDGSATLAAHGIVGSERAAAGERPRGTPYTYHVDAKFSADSGSGHRTKGRNCTVSFTRMAP